MYPHHLVRYGMLGNVGRFMSVDAGVLRRNTRVVVRTKRGLEIGQVLVPSCEVSGEPDGTLLRRVSIEDELLLARLERHKQRAYQACQDLLVQRGLPAVLVDVEHLFDGSSLWFYFLGEDSPELAEITDQLAELYKAEVQFHQFAETLEKGCGPGCGTEEAAGHGCGDHGCSSCAVAGACGTRRGG